MMIVMVVVMGFLSRQHSCRLPFREDHDREIEFSGGVWGIRRGQVPLFSRITCSKVRDDSAALAAESVSFAIMVSASAARSRVRRATQALCQAIGCIFRIGFGGETLRGFQRRSNGICIRFGTWFFRFQLAEELVQLCAVPRHVSGSEILLVFVFVHEPVHESIALQLGPF